MKRVINILIIKEFSTHSCSAKGGGRRATKERGRVRGAGGLGRVYSRSPSVKRGVLQEVGGEVVFGGCGMIEGVWCSSI